MLSNRLHHFSKRGGRPVWGAIQPDRRAVSAIEFALIAPVLVTILLGAVDITRALIDWQRVCNAARAVAQAAEKLSVASGTVQSSLTATQVQSAMSTIYAEMPGLSTSDANDGFAVALSSVVYEPRCATATNCGNQAPYVLWSAYLNEGPSGLLTTVVRPCGAAAPVSVFPDSVSGAANEVSAMIVPSGGQKITLTPEVVADVVYYFKPIFAIFISSVPLVASAAMPAPIGDPSQEITFNASAGSTAVTTCAALP